MAVTIPPGPIDAGGLLEPAGLLLLGGIIFRAAWIRARRNGLLGSTFWESFFQFAPYRLKRLGSVAMGALGAFLLIWGCGLLFAWVRAYYAARLGHFGP
jgi:hypothetical protein